MVRHCPNPDCPGLARDGVVAEYRASVARCVDCGSVLVSGERPAMPEAAAEYVELVTVFIASGIAQGQVVAGVVEAAGIPVFLKGEHLLGAVGELPPNVAQLEVQVPVERAEEARAITLEWERPSSAEAEAGTGGRSRGRDDASDDSDDAVHGAVEAVLGRAKEVERDGKRRDD